VLTVMGTTSVPLLTLLVRDESASVVAAALRDALSESQRSLVTSVTTDWPTHAHVVALSAVLPNLRVLALDPVHAAFKYEDTFGRRRTPGSRALRGMLRKFWQYDPSQTASAWGPPFDGRPLPGELSRLHHLHRHYIRSHSMPIAEAELALATLSPDTPWRCASDFVHAVAALSAVHQSEICRSGTSNAGELTRHLLNITSSTRVEWMMNNLRILHSMPAHLRPLAATGTTCNEAFHAEMNQWFRNGKSTYRSTVHVQLSCGTLAKLLAHSHAWRSPSLRQQRHDEVLTRTVFATSLTAASWRSYCERGTRGGWPLCAASIPFFRIRQRLQKVLRERRGSNDAAASDATLPYRTPFRHRKRTVFSLPRVGRLSLPPLERAPKRRRISLKVSCGDPRWYPGEASGSHLLG